jgi:hypothetical protein
LKETGGWSFGIFVAEDVRGIGGIASDRLFREITEARRTHGTRRRVVM